MAKVAPPARTSHISRRRENARADGGADYAGKRQELVSIAATLFKEKGLKATTLADIGERAGLDRATLYYYVGSKQELFQACIEGSLDDNLAAIEGLLVNRSFSAREKLETLIAIMMKSYDTHYPQMYVYIQEQMHEVGNDPSKWARDIQRKTRRFEAIVREMIDEGIASGVIRADLDPKIAANALFGMLSWTHRWYKPGSGLPGATIADMFAKLFFDGMTGPAKTRR